MAERRENSVLFSLRELRQIEDDRVKQEEDDVKRAAEEERQKVLAAEKARRDAEEQARRDAEAAEQRRLHSEELRLREEQIRLEEVERRHRVEAEARLEEQRLQLEIAAKTELAKKKKPWALIIASSVLFVLVAGLGVYLYLADQESKRVIAQKEMDKKAAEDALAQQKKDIDAQLAKISAADEENTKLVAQLKNTQDANEQKRIQGEIAANAERKRIEADRLEAIRKQDYKNRTKAVNFDKCKGSTDPNCGL
jgi:hypothetical protein